MSAPDAQGWIGALIGAAAAAVTTLLMLRRRLSRDGTEVIKDRAEGDLVQTLRAERDAALAEAQRVREQRTSDAETIARLRSDNEHLRADTERLLKDIRRMMRGLPSDVRRVLATEFGDLGPPEEPAVLRAPPRPPLPPQDAGVGTFDDRPHHHHEPSPPKGRR